MADDAWGAIAETDGEDAPPIEPGSPAPEHALFVILGVLAMVFVIAQVAGVV